jgi:hypothetical protein
MKKIFLFFYRVIKKFLPQKLNYFIWDIYLSNISKKSYSQYGEDLIISGGSIGYVRKVIS